MEYVFNWEYSFEPTFPVHVFPYTVVGNRDKMHWHEYFEIGLCLSGEGRFIYMNKEYPVKAGDIFMTNNFENHVAISENAQVTEYIFLIFLPSFIADPNGKQFYLEYLLPFQYNPLEFKNRIVKEEFAAKSLKGLILAAHEVYSSKQRFFKQELDILLRKILLEIARHYFPAQKGIAHDLYQINDKVQKAIQYMNTHFNETLTVVSMAEYLDISTSYFRHLFCKSTKIPFKTYLTFLRIAQAKKLLLGTDKTIDAIISEVGYGNVTQFYKTFQRYVSMSPAQYRKRYRMIIGDTGSSTYTTAKHVRPEKLRDNSY